MNGMPSLVLWFEPRRVWKRGRHIIGAHASEQPLSHGTAWMVGGMPQGLVSLSRRCQAGLRVQLSGCLGCKCQLPPTDRLKALVAVSPVAFLPYPAAFCLTSWMSFGRARRQNQLQSSDATYALLRGIKHRFQAHKKYKSTHKVF